MADFAITEGVPKRDLDIVSDVAGAIAKGLVRSDDIRTQRVLQDLRERLERDLRVLRTDQYGIYARNEKPTSSSSHAFTREEVAANIEHVLEQFMKDEMSKEALLLIGTHGVKRVASSLVLDGTGSVPIR